MEMPLPDVRTADPDNQTFTHFFAACLGITIVIVLRPVSHEKSSLMASKHEAGQSARSNSEALATAKNSSAAESAAMARWARTSRRYPWEMSAWSSWEPVNSSQENRPGAPSLGSTSRPASLC